MEIYTISSLRMAFNVDFKVNAIYLIKLYVLFVCLRVFCITFKTFLLALSYRY